MNRAFATAMFTVAATVAVVGCSGTDGTSGDGTEVATTSESLLFHNPAGFDDGNPATQCVVKGISVHCCFSFAGNTPSVMIGARVDQNVFKCAELLASNPSDGSPAFLDGPGQPTNTIRPAGSGIHACPLGSLMTGYHHDRDLLLCQKLANAGHSGPLPLKERVDPIPGLLPMEDSYPMHVCGNTEAMGGINISQNVFLCDR
jgi:hypothetical protein